MTRITLRQTGFSLLEVLVAFSILAISLGVLLPVFSDGLRSTSVAREYNHAVILAEAKLAELTVMDLLASGDSEGDFDERFHWHASFSDYASENAPRQDLSPVSAYSIAVTVSWGDTPRERSIVITTLRLSNG